MLKIYKTLLNIRADVDQTVQIISAVPQNFKLSEDTNSLVNSWELEIM